MDSPVRYLRQIRRRVQSVTYGSAIYRMMLDQGPVPETVRLQISDPWPGDAKKGQRLIASQPGLFDAQALAEEKKSKCLLTHEWLRDLRAVGTDIARRKAASLIHEWVSEQQTWDEAAWEPEILGARLANWIAFYEFYEPALSEELKRMQLASMARQLRHLIHVAPAYLTGMDSLNVIKGLVYGGLALLEGERAMGLALDFLGRQLDEEILPDGGVISRSPMRLANMLRAFIDIRAAFRAANLEVPHELDLTIMRMVPALKLFRHGDGNLAIFQGACEGDALMLDAILTMAEAKGRLLKRLPQMGYERITAGRSLLLMDVSGPPPRGFDGEAQAGLLAFEFSAGRERIIVNCGSGQESSEEWRHAMAATAAHSTVALADKNACEVLPDGGIGHRPQDVTAQRYEQDGIQFIEASHDGYYPRHKTTVGRLLGLAKDGEQLMGREIIAGPKGKDFTIRWHLHPSVTALLVQSGRAALLRTASGAGWRFCVQSPEAMDLALEASVYCGGDAPRRTLQIRLSGRSFKEQTIVEWTLSRELIKKETKKGGKRGSEQKT